MRHIRLIATTCISTGAVALLAFGIAGLQAQRRGSGQTAQALFAALDTHKAGTLTRSELESGFNSWFTAWNTTKSGTLTQSQIEAGVSTLLPAPPAVKPGQANTFNPAGNSTPVAVSQAAVAAMMAALPTTPGARPMRSRRVLVLAHTGAGGFVHASIPLAAKTVEALGNQGGLWTTTVTYDAADINTANLKKYDAIFLDSTTACFLDDPNPAVTTARRAAFLSFVRGGKGIAAIHAATDSYHTDCVAGEAAAKSGSPGRNLGALVLASRLVTAANGSRGETVSRQQWAALADDWFRKLDTGNTGKVTRADFVANFNSLLPPPDMRHLHLEAKPVLQWPEFNKLIGGYFKFHWPDPQLITVKIDDPKSPLTAMFHGKEFEIHDETYTFEQDSFSRKNVHVLTSIDYGKMSAEDKAKEADPRTDGDYALSYIRREGNGRVFYEGHGHSDRVYAMTPMLEHLRAGIQYALGDLKADDSPSVK
ncbi:ThuA domain-containing protein [Edaphobacter sp. 12200R-103]|uniref:ThuA domain-containing protein n=1 Tax=Edaphobacter sp. 12200R-103 TaxID=2703788 RepID=UPI001EE40AC2|nr:ThuA domain-containing protein [Edaphobacter sp. 12200R-103]